MRINRDTSKLIITFRYLLPIFFIAIGFLYFYVNPFETVWIPKCSMKLLTHTDCPSCGIQRAFSLCLNGQFLDAIKLNPFLIISMPYILLVLIGKVYNINHCFDEINRIILNKYVVLSFLALFFVWWIIRVVYHI